MNVRLQQLNPIIGDIDGNVRAILEAVRKAETANVDLLILPELVVTGYPPMDLLERMSFREAVYKANKRIVEATGSTTLVFGTVTPNGVDFGRNCYNAAIVARNGEVAGEVHKTLLPTYDVFDDLRYFEPNDGFRCVELNGASLGITICEDIWYNENDIQYHTYEINPAHELAKRGADVIINISASPFTKTKPSSRLRMLQRHAEALNLPIFYANQVGANTELVFDGDSMVVGADAGLVARACLFEEDAIDVGWDVEKAAICNQGRAPADVPVKAECLFKGLVRGVKDYLRKTNVTDKVILGLSGGIDSTLVACIASEAVGPDKVLAVTMPTEFSSEGSVSDSERLTRNLGIRLENIPVGNVFNGYREILAPLFGDNSFGVAEENLQPRIRGTLLMAIANKQGRLLLNTGNKSEMATGYCTLYGDMAGGLGVISDLYKKEVYEVARWLNESYYQREVIPPQILNKLPSAELRPGQKDTDSLPEYDELDSILHLYIEEQQSREHIVQQGFNPATVDKVIRLVDRSEFKRYQAAPGLKMSTKAFGTGRRWPIVQDWTGNQL